MSFVLTQLMKSSAIAELQVNDAVIIMGGRMWEEENK